MEKEIYSLEIYPDYTGLEDISQFVKSKEFLKSIDYTGKFIVYGNRLFREHRESPRREEFHNSLEHREADLSISNNLEAISKGGAVIARMKCFQGKVYYSPDKILSMEGFNFLNGEKRILCNIEAIRIN